MIRIIFSLVSVMLLGCMTESEKDPAPLAKYNGTLQSQDNALLLTIDYPKWSAHYYAMTPGLYVSGTVDSISTDSIIGIPEDHIIHRTFIHFSVTEFHQADVDGIAPKTDTALIIKTGFTKTDSGLVTQSLIEYKIVSDSGTTLTTPFIFTGHKLK